MTCVFMMLGQHWGLNVAGAWVHCGMHVCVLEELDRMGLQRGLNVAGVGARCGERGLLAWGPQVRLYIGMHGGVYLGG